MASGYTNPSAIVRQSAMVFIRRPWPFRRASVGVVICFPQRRSRSTILSVPMNVLEPPTTRVSLLSHHYANAGFVCGMID